MLHKLLDFLLSLLRVENFVQKIKKDEHGICYVTGLRRYLSVLLDLIIIALFLQLYGQLLYRVSVNSENDKILSQVAAKYNMQIPLSHEEEIAKSRYIKCIILNQISQLIVIFIYTSYMWAKFGGTPGRLLFGLRIVDSKTFTKITIKQAAKRFFALMLSTLPLFLGFIWAYFNKRCQTWHDKIAHTVVVTNKSLQQYRTK
ncbi:MAG: RDD family protein [Wolbachia endosymbiont of Fragariocoptes setiger]|nr:RDD family protein [Wolbachia endosymbiont of Fragariocoptes setiger]